MSRIVGDVFARDIGERAAVIESFFEDRRRNTELILSKPWPTASKQDLINPDQTILLAISRDLVTFDPRADPYALIRLSRDPELAVDQLRRLADELRSGADLFQLLADWGRSGGATVLRRGWDAIELKPGVFGFAIDLKELFRRHD